MSDHLDYAKSALRQAKTAPLGSNGRGYSAMAAVAAAIAQAEALESIAKSLEAMTDPSITHYHFTPPSPPSTPQGPYEVWCGTGYVGDAGGGCVQVVVDRDTAEYPPMGGRATVTVEQVPD